MANPLISICIPTYKRSDFLKRLLDSLTQQSFRDFEVVISDDSPSNEVALLLESYSGLPISYNKNLQPLGTPANWNQAIRNAKGKWIKLMHDDDWFAGPDSLKLFADAALHSNCSFIFSNYSNIFFPANTIQRVHPSLFRLNKLKKDPVILVSSNIIGPPSVMMHKNEGRVWYDERIKWLVDIDFYVRYLEGNDFWHIAQDLVRVGISEEQVTQSCFRNPSVEIPEHFLFLQKTGIKKLRNLITYDAWWRLFRNLDIRNKEDLVKYSSEQWPPLIYILLADLGRWPRAILKTGPISKFLMLISYLKNYSRIR